MAYIGNFPTSTGFNSLNFQQNTITKQTKTQSGRSIRTTNATTLWSATLQFPTMTQEEFRPVQAFIALAQGALNEFDVILPSVSISLSSGSAVSSKSVDGDHTAGDTTINISTTLTSQNLLKAGDVIRFENHTKVYMVTSDINTDGSGDATLNIQPALVENLTNGEDITLTNVPFRMTITNDIQEFGYRTDGLIDYEIDIEEVL
jgi:hypothetical protein